MKLLYKSELKTGLPDFVDAIVVDNRIVDSSIEQYTFSNKVGEKYLVYSNTIADCLNAVELNASAIIWQGDHKIIEGIYPKNRPYGWALLTVHLPLFIHLETILDINQYQNVDFQGVYSESIDLLKDINDLLKSNN